MGNTHGASYVPVVISPRGTEAIGFSTGRFFAATVLKVLTAHTVVTYDVKLPGNSRSIPPPMWISTLLFPNRKANVLFRKRDVYK